MEKIKEIRISLMEKDVIPSEEEDKENFIIRSTGRLNDPAKITEAHGIEIGDILSDIYDSLLHESKGTFHSIGMWVTFENGDELDNSIKLSVFEDIKNYGVKGVDPMKEFFKMTLEINEG